MRRKLIGLRTIVGGGLIGVVAINAAFLQAGPHPAPLFLPNDKLAGKVPLPHLKRPDMPAGQREHTGSAPAASLSGDRDADLPSWRPHVLALQRVLADLGYAPGPIDGIAGASTREAIKRFERHYGLPVTGQVSQTLIEHVERVSGVVLLPADSS